MRKYIIKFFASDYIVNIGGYTVSFTRSANIIFPLCVFNGFLVLLENYYPLLFLISFSLFLLSLFFGFVYFKYFPLTDKDYDRLDEVQKYIYNAYTTTNSDNVIKYNGLWVVLVNPIVVILFLIMYIFI